MDFSEIEFSESGRKDRPGLGLTVSGRYWVAKTTFQLAWDLLWAEHERWNLQQKQCAENLCGSVAWRNYGDRSRCLSLGRAIKYFVNNGMLPWEEINKGKKGKRWYRYLSPIWTGGADPFRLWRPEPKAIQAVSADIWMFPATIDSGATSLIQ